MSAQRPCGPLNGAVNRVLLMVAVVVVAAACATDDATTSTGPRPSSEGPFVQEDPADLIAGTFWVDPTGRTPALPRPIAHGEPGAVLTEGSEPQLLEIAVNGNGCVPQVGLSVLQDSPALKLQISLGEAIPDPGLQCADILTTHAFKVRLTRPVSLENVQLSVVP